MGGGALAAASEPPAGASSAAPAVQHPLSTALPQPSGTLVRHRATNWPPLQAGENAHDHIGHGHSHDANSHGGGEGFAGLVLVGGFLSMLILDHIQHAAGDPHGISHSGPQHHHGGGQPSCGHSHGHGHGGGGHSHGHSAAAHGHASPPDPGPATPRDALDGAEMVFDSCDLEVAFGPQLPPKGTPACPHHLPAHAALHSGWGPSLAPAAARWPAGVAAAAVVAQGLRGGLGRAAEPQGGWR